MDEARAEFEKALSIAPDDPITIQNLADLYRVLNRPQDAVKQLQHWVQLAPTDYNAHKNLSLLYRDLHQVTEAITEAQKSISVAPEDQKAGLQQYLQELQGQKVTP